MNDLKRLVRLKTLTAVQFVAAQSTSASLAAREKGLRDNLAQLVQEKRRTIERDVPDDAARAAGADIRWHRWVDERRAIINIELAQVLSEKLECQRSLARAFGRDQAVATLLDKQQKTEAKQQQKREI